jgi:putative ABC transport system permease protein
LRITDYITQAFFNLRRKKLRTFLTTFGVVIGIGALVSMFSFGQGVQKNITDRFKELQLFNCINVFPGTEESNDCQPAVDKEKKQHAILDDDFIQRVGKIEGVEFVFIEVRFPGQIRLENEDGFTLIQVLPAEVCRSKLIKLRSGRTYLSDEENSLIISNHLLHQMDIKNPDEAIGREVEISTVVFDFTLLNPENIASIMQGDKIPLSNKSYFFTIVGVSEGMGFESSMPIGSDVFIPPGPAGRMEKLNLTSIWDFFRSPRRAKGYSMVSIRVSSPKYIEPVKKQIEDWGFETFALIDEIVEIKKAFIFMNMFLLAIGMIAITVASLGIINTMVMSILERYKEIGIMKAVGASDTDVKRIFFFESGAIGLLGGVFWTCSWMGSKYCH